MDVDHGLIRDLETTPANVHDNEIDLSLPGEVVYRDYGLSGREAEGMGRDDAAWCPGSPVEYMGSAPE
jgi:IS5 family transposase